MSQRDDESNSVCRSKSFQRAGTPPRDTHWREEIHLSFNLFIWIIFTAYPDIPDAEIACACVPLYVNLSIFQLVCVYFYLILPICQRVEYSFQSFNRSQWWRMLKLPKTRYRHWKYPNMKENFANRRKSCDS